MKGSIHKVEAPRANSLRGSGAAPFMAQGWRPPKENATITLDAVSKWWVPKGTVLTVRTVWGLFIGSFQALPLQVGGTALTNFTLFCAPSFDFLLKEKCHQIAALRDFTKLVSIPSQSNEGTCVDLQ